MADRLPLKLQDIGNGEGRLREFEPGDKMPVGVIPTDGLLEHLGLSESGKTVATGTPEQGRAALELGDAALADVVGEMSAGAIIERGSNANGEYVRFADGTQECWRYYPDLASPGANATLVTEWVYPAAFSGGPVLHGTAATPSPETYIAITVGFGDYPSTSGLIYSRRPAAYSHYLHVRAVGRWY